MTDEELWSFLAGNYDRFSFDQLSEEWKAWAKAVVRSARVDTAGKGRMSPSDAVLYLCQVMRVFANLHEGTGYKGITNDNLRGKFVSGLVVSGLPPETDASFVFFRALQDAEGSGYVEYEDVGWGREEERYYRLSLAGRKLADNATIVDPSETAQPTPANTAERTADQPDYIAVWQNARAVLGTAKELHHEIAELDEWENGDRPWEASGTFPKEATISLIATTTQSIERMHGKARFAHVDESVFPGTENTFVDGVNCAISSVFSCAKGLVTRIGLGRFDTDDYPIRADSKEVYRLVKCLKDEIGKLELVPAVHDYMARVAREKLRESNDGRRNADRPLSPETAYLIVKYLDHAERPILCTTDLFEQDLAILAELVGDELAQTDTCSYSVRAVTESRLSPKELVAIRVGWTDLEKLAECGPDYERVVDFPHAGWGRYLDAHFSAMRYLDEVRRSADERAFMASCESDTSQSVTVLKSTEQVTGPEEPGQPHDVMDDGEQTIGEGEKQPIEHKHDYEMIPPNQFRWQQHKPVELPPLQWSLLSYCLANPRVKIQDVADNVWGVDLASEKSDKAIDSLKCKLNTRLAQVSIPISLARKTGFVILSIDEPGTSGEGS